MENEFNFSTKIEPAEINGINKYLGIDSDIDIEYGRPTATVKYELEFEAREWGLKYIAVNVKKVTATIEWETDCEFLSDADKEALTKAGGIEMRNETFAGTIEIEATIVNWEIENEAEFESDGGFKMDYITINVADKTITIQ